MRRGGQVAIAGAFALACGLALACSGAGEDAGADEGAVESAVCEDWCAQLDSLACPQRETPIGTCRTICQDDFAALEPACRPLIDDYTSCVLASSSFECGAATGDVFIGTPGSACDSEKQALADAGCPERTLLAGG